MKRTETIAHYKEAFLEGKSDEIRANFENKDINKQYASIVAWKRRQAGKSDNGVTVSSIVELLRNAKKAISQLSDLSDKDTEKIASLCNEVAEEAANFDMIKKSRKLRQLKEQQDSIARAIAELEEEGVK